jgi:fructokinase
MPDEQRRPVVFGEVLFDQFPDGSVVLGGAPFNVAWHLQAFGQAPLFISRVGDDALGRRIRDAMLDWGMDTTGLQLDPVHPTGTVTVTIRDGEPHYDILAERAYDFIEPAGLPPLPGSGLLYHGSLALRHPVSRAACEALANALWSAVFVDVNLRPPWVDPEHLRATLHGARWAKLNEHELATLVPRAGDLLAQAAELQAATGIELLVITRGAQGAVLRRSNGTVEQVAPAVRASAVVDTVGAGDAFASVLILGLLQGWELPQTLQRAQEFASALVGVRGATLADPDFYAGFRQRWAVA